MGRREKPGDSGRWLRTVPRATTLARMRYATISEGRTHATGPQEKEKHATYSRRSEMHTTGSARLCGWRATAV